MDPTTQRNHKTALTALDDKFETALSAFATAAGERCDGIEAEVEENDTAIRALLVAREADIQKRIKDEVEAIFVVLRLESESQTAALAAATEPLRRGFFGRLKLAIIGR